MTSRESIIIGVLLVVAVISFTYAIKWFILIKELRRKTKKLNEEKRHLNEQVRKLEEWNRKS